MQPIVDGLREKYGDRVDFVVLNAGDGAAGQVAYAAYGALGHPAFVWVEPGGSVGWRMVGEQSEDALEAAIQESLK